MSPPDLEKPEEKPEVGSPGAEALPDGGLAGTPEAACTGRQAECTWVRVSTSRGRGPRGPTVSWGSSPGTTRFSPEKEKKGKEIT